ESCMRPERHLANTPWPGAAWFEDGFRCRAIDPVVPGFDEVARAAAVLRVGADISGNRRREEVVERHEELHAEVVGDEIIEQKEAHVTAEVAEEGEGVGIPRQRGREWAFLVQEVAADALE